MPVPPRSLAALAAITHRMERAGVEWLVAGGTGRALLGGTARPGDIDLEVAGADVHRAAAALDLAARVDAGGGVRSLRAAGLVAGVALDLSADVEVRGPGGLLRPDWPAQLAAAVDVRHGGLRLRVAPPGEALARARVLADDARARRALDGLRADPRPSYCAARLSRATSSASS